CLDDTDSLASADLSLHDALPISWAALRWLTRLRRASAVQPLSERGLDVPRPYATPSSGGFPRGCPDRDHSALWSPNVIEPGTNRDRKSTRLNSSHVSISYAVFCL